MAARLRTKWSILSVGAAVLVLLAFAAYQVSRARCFTLVGEVICRVETRRPIVALSFDDGPTVQGIDAALPALAEAHAKATFFLVGTDSEKRPDLVRRIAAAGHEIGNHSYSHAHMVAKAPGFYDSEIARTDSILRRAGAPPPSLFRPPYGKKLIGLPLAVRRHGYLMVTWDVEDPADKKTDPASYAANIVREARPGSIILMHIMHSPNRRARQALPLVLAGLHRKGFRVVTVGELLHETARR